MAAPRCAKSFLGPAKRVKISTPKVYTPAPIFSRTKTSRSKDEDEEKDNKVGFKGSYDTMSMEEKLEDLGVDPAEYRSLYKSQLKAEREFKKWEPKTAEEAKKRWEEAKKTPDHNTLLHLMKRGGVEPIKLAKERNITLPGGEKEPLDAKTQAALDELRTPLNIRAINLRPLRRAPEHGIPVCDLQLRTYSIRNLLLFADFAMRAAYYMGLPARGPVPLPRITERWTVPRANFVFKKSQENFERITMRRLIQIQDGHPDVVKAWLAFLAKHQYYGVGMKANVWEYESLDSALGVGHEVKEGDYEGRREREMLEKVSEILQGESYQSAMKGYQAPEELERTRP